MRLRCPECQGEVEAGTFKVGGLTEEVAVVQCPKCRLVGVVGSPEPWVHRDDRDFVLKLYTIVDRIR